MARLNDRLVSEIRITCQRIKFNDLLECNIIEDVFHIGIDELETEMNRYKLLSRSLYQLSHFLAETIRTCTTEELREKLNYLKAWGVATKNQTRTWRAFTLFDPLDKDNRPVCDANKLKKELTRSFRMKSLNAIISVVNHQNMLWCAISGKKLTRRSGVKMEPTVFFCVSPGNPFLFITPKNFPTEKLQRVVFALNYARMRNCHLSGRNISSLLKMIKTRAETNASVDEVTLSPANIEVSHRHTDFTRGKNIKRYANRCFDKDVALQKLTVESVSEWRGTEIAPEMEGEQLTTTMEITSTNVAETLTYYASIGVIRPPFPTYLKNLIYNGKNDFKLRNKNKNLNAN